MKTIIKKLPKLTILFILINCLIFLLTEYIVGVNLKYALSSNPFDSDNFYFFQIITSSFVHSSLSHLLSNIFIFILFAPLVEKFLGNKKFILLILLSSIINFSTYQFIVYKNKKDIEVEFKEKKLSPKDIVINNNFEVDYKNSKVFKLVDLKTAEYISEKYATTKKIGHGFSVCVFSFLMVFLLHFNIKKLFLSIISLLLVSITMYGNFYGYEFEYSHSLHLSGIILGILFFYINKKGT